MKPLLIDLDYTLADTFMVKEMDVPYFVNTHHFHKDYEIVYVKEGSGKRVIGDHVEEFADGDLVFVGPNLPHVWFNDKEYYDGSASLRARSVVIYLKRNWLEEVVLRLPQVDKLRKLLDKTVRGVKITGPASDRIGQIAAGIYRSEGLRQTVDLFLMLHEMSETPDCKILASVDYLNTHNENETVRLNNVYEYVMRNFSSDIRLTDVADVANMTPNAFCRYFKKQTQKNFSQFVNEIRVGHACRLLRQKELSIAQVCYESGYQSLTNFNKFFRRIAGKSPLAYRKEF